MAEAVLVFLASVTVVGGLAVVLIALAGRLLQERAARMARVLIIVALILVSMYLLFDLSGAYPTRRFI